MSRYWPPIIPSVAPTSSRGDLGRLVAQREPQRLREERVSGEERGTLAERDPCALAAATLDVVVHRGQVVVDQREGVHELDRGGCGKRVVDRATGRVCDGEAQDRADALAPGLERVAKCFLERAELGRERQRA